MRTMETSEEKISGRAGAAARSAAATLKKHAPYLGLSVYLALPFLLFYSNIVKPEAISYEDLSVISGISSLAFALELLVLGVSRGKTHEATVGGRPLYAAGILASAGIVVGIIGALVPESLAMPLEVLASAVFGIGTAYVGAHYGVLYTQLDGKKISIVFPLCYLAAAVMTAILQALPTTIARIIAVALPLLPLHSLNTHLEQPQLARSPQSQSLHSVLTPLWKILASFCVFGLVFGFQRGIMTSEIQEEFPVVGVYVYYLAMGLSSLLLSLSCWKKTSTIGTSSIYKLAAIVIAVGLLCIIYVPDYGELIGSICIAMAYIGFDLAVWITLADYTRRTKRFGLAIYAFGMAASHLGMALGVFLGMAANALGGTTGQAAQAITAVIELLILVVALFTFSTTDTLLVSTREAGADDGKGSAEESPAQLRSEACDKLASTNDLTKREREVLGLLLEGRNVPAIEEMLCLSESTVKTHKRHIYEKLGIHSQQELLDLADKIEGRR